MTKPKRIPTHQLRKLAVEAEADPRTVRKVYEGKPVRGLALERVRRVLAAAGLLAALLLFQGCAEADVAQQLAPGTGGNAVATGGQVGTGGASTIPGTGGNREDAKAPAGPEAGADGGWDVVGAGADVATDAGGTDSMATEAGRDLSPKDELFTIPCGSNYGETSMCPPPQMCAPSRYCQYTCTLGSTATNQGCPDGLTCRISSLRWDFCS